MAGVSDDTGLSILLSLIRSSLWGIPADGQDGLRKMDEREWQALLGLAEGQTVTGLLYQALEKLPADIAVPDSVSFSLMSRIDRIERRNKEIGHVELDTISRLHAAGIHPIVMKGSRCAAMYPVPSLREQGDIDIYIRPGELPKVLNVLEEASLNAEAQADSSICYSDRGVVVEIHPRYFDLHCPDSVLPEIPSPEAEILMLAAHILKHACGTGTGLRQLCDFALAYHFYPGPYSRLDRLFEACGIVSWANLLISFVAEWLDPTLESRGTDTRPLLRIIRKDGNFGHNSASRRARLQGNTLARKADTALRLATRMPFAARYGGREYFRYVADLIRGN